jgi:hypothetical protein
MRFQFWILNFLDKQANGHTDDGDDSLFRKLCQSLQRTRPLSRNRQMGANQ